MISLVRRLFRRRRLDPPQVDMSLPEPRPEKVEERAVKDRIIDAHLKANARGRDLMERRSRRDTIRYMASLEEAMAILGDRK